ncbi:hypothetical protein AALP_AA3G189900 [Arabis alpina]|uniref:Uncharacterized protein n=1 Tax=Arabis alpina TaxID=50452 RepID=A0A087HA65_ARAAL|nr:hypothetical protein AALP_AA3G189900 [Arabis alpina]
MVVASEDRDLCLHLEGRVVLESSTMRFSVWFRVASHSWSRFDFPLTKGLHLSVFVSMIWVHCIVNCLASLGSQLNVRLVVSAPLPLTSFASGQQLIG